MPEQIGRYEIINELGKGGMAVVYLARDPFMKRQVAVKVLPRQFTFDPQFRARFRREAEAIAGLNTPPSSPFTTTANMTTNRTSSCATCPAAHSPTAWQSPACHWTRSPPSSPGWPPPSTSPTNVASFTATSNPATSSSTSGAKPTSPISAS